jgi:ABC-2 type transport system ATP-binding protein/teichoic acid transport system ATP-binding protein
MPGSANTRPSAIKVQNVSLTYRTTFERVPTFKSAIVRFGRGERAVREVEAVRNVSLVVPHGTTLGIIGANGAGKSTLMRMIAGILPPTSGRIIVRGKVSTLLALGVGFNPSLSGRENVMLGGLAMGMSRKEVTERYEEIAAFAELGDFIDMPMRTYSSGMYSRLAFSVSVHMQPDILLIDEALSAGDASFKQKAAEKMKSLMAHASTMCLVSHALGSVKDLCSHTLWLHKGRLMMHDETPKVIDEYNRFLKVGESAYTFEDF